MSDRDWRVRQQLQRQEWPELWRQWRQWGQWRWQQLYLFDGPFEPEDL